MSNFEENSALVLPHYKRNLGYHSRRVQYEIPKEEQILFEIDENSLDSSSQTYAESHFANLMNVAKKIPKNSIEEKKVENEKKKKNLEEIKREENDINEHLLNSKSISIENILKSQHFINKILNKKPEEPKLAEIPKLQSKIGRHIFNKSQLSNYPKTIQNEEEIQKNEKNFKSFLNTKETEETQQNQLSPQYTDKQTFQSSTTFDPQFQKQKNEKPKKKKKKESLLKKRKKKNSFESFSFWNFIETIKTNLKNLIPFIFNFISKILKINPFKTNEFQGRDQRITSETTYQNF